MELQRPAAVLSHQTNLFPPPLHIRKTSRRATCYRQILRKSSHRPGGKGVYGPLDDIIDEITGDIWSTPPECSFEWSLPCWENPLDAHLNYQNPLKAPSTCTVTPMPVSRMPSDQPLTVRKNRNSRSTTSGSSESHSMTFLRGSSSTAASGRSANTSNVSVPPNGLASPFLLSDVLPHADTTQANSSNRTISIDHTPAQQALGDVQSADQQAVPTGTRPSRLRVFTQGFKRFHRQGKDDSANSNISPPTSRPNASSLESHNELGNENGSEEEATEQSVEILAEKNARSVDKIQSLVTRVGELLPSPNNARHDEDGEAPSDDSIPTTLKVAVKTFPESKMLNNHSVQDLWVAVDIQGELHNRHPLVDDTLDIIFIIDNRYYVSKECLSRACAAIMGTLYQVSRGDRVALYTTHCTHPGYASTIPDLFYPLGPVNNDTEHIFRSLTKEINKLATQAWEPPSPIPVMGDVVVAIMKSLGGNDLKRNRAHVLFLSPVAHSLHRVCEAFPDIQIHQVNPTALPCQRHEDLHPAFYANGYYKQVTFHNCSHYRSLPDHIKSIFRNARAQKPVGELSNVHVAIQAKKGCEIIEYQGSRDIGHLCLGQVHSIFVRVRAEGSKTQEIDLQSRDVLLQSSLGSDNLREQLRNAKVVGATMAHLLTVQVIHQDALRGRGNWFYAEHQLVITKDLGRLAVPHDVSMELYRRQLFYGLSRLGGRDYFENELERFLACARYNKEGIREIAGPMAKEARHQLAVLEYERTVRAKVPVLPGPVCLAGKPHWWLQDMWDAKKNKRRGMAII